MAETEAAKASDDDLPADLRSAVESIRAKSPNARLQAFKLQKQWFVIRAPTQAEWDRYVDDKNASQSTNVLIGACVVYPSPTALQVFLEKFPASKQSPKGFLSRIGAHAGSSDKDSEDPKDL
jgi:hypothetical protein